MGSNISEKNPNHLSMSGMICEANKVLDWVMDTNTGGLQPDLFGPSLKGIAFITNAEAACVFSGNIGTGIVLAHRPDGSWSAPSAIGVTGIGCGFMIGTSLKHLVYLIYEEETLRSMSGTFGVTLGTKVESAILNWGRSAEATTIISNKGWGADICLHYSQGIFGGLSVAAGVCNPRNAVNEKFYGKKLTPSKILFDGRIDIPEGTEMPEIYAKLNYLCYFQHVLRMAVDNRAGQQLNDESTTVASSVSGVATASSSVAQTVEARDDENVLMEDWENEERDYELLEEDIKAWRFPLRKHRPLSPTIPKKRNKATGRRWWEGHRKQ